LEEHNTPRAYQQIKQRIFKLLKPGGLAIVNADDHRCRNVTAKITAPCLTYALHAEADVTASVLERFVSEQTFLLSAGNDTAAVRTRMIGDHHVSNCLAAACFGLAAGFDLATIVRGLEGVERVPGRLERLECGQPFGVFVDMAQSPETLARAITTVRQVTSGRTIVVFGPREEHDAARKALLGRVLERGAQLAIITGDEPRQMELETAHQVLDGFNQPGRAHVIRDRAAAIRFALSQARAGDCLLIAGRGDRVSALRVGKSYDDREVACGLLYGRDERESCRRQFRVVG
jgi:UDP-N-acetylmuramoyl-L-alanyl-D-glutamate--2,6-diaminopimelate ligase